MLKGLLS